MKRIKPLHFYLLFVGFILISRLFENKVDTAYYFFVVLGWVCFFLAVKKYFANRKSKVRRR